MEPVDLGLNDVVIKPASHHLDPITNNETGMYHWREKTELFGVSLFGTIVPSLKAHITNNRKLCQVWANPETMLTLNTHDGILWVWSGPFVSTERLEAFMEDGQYKWDKILTYTARFISLVTVQRVMLG